jgi:hypothetical protein
MTCTTTLTSDDSIATPATLAIAIPVEAAPANAYKLSLWKQVRSLVGQTSPTPRRPFALGVDGHFPAFRSGKREHTLVLLDEDLVADDIKGAKCFDKFEEDDERSADGESSDYSCGLAGWFADRAAEQRRAKEEQAAAAAARERAAYAKRGRKLKRTEAAASYYAVR